MDGLQSFEPISGSPGEVGTKSKLYFKMGKRDIQMIETITENNLPDSFAGTYEADGVFNIVRNEFSEIDENRTRWTSQNECQFNSFIMKIMGFFMPGEFKKQSVKYLQNFKKFAENEN